MIERWIRALAKAGVDADHVQLAEVLWLAQQLPPKLAPQTVPGSVTESTVETKPLAPPEAPEMPTEAKSEERQPEATTLGVYTASPTKYSSARMVRASRIHVPEAPALPNALAIARALRPFTRRFPSRTRYVFDEAATVHNYAEFEILNPVLAPEFEHWFDVALVIDDAPSMVIWRRTIGEFHGLLLRHGAFRDVRRWTLLADDVGVRVGSESGLVRSSRELIVPTAKRLILLVTDCASSAWDRAPLWDTIAGWGARTPVVLIHMLPAHLWGSTGLGPTSVSVRSELPGIPNQLLQAEALGWDFEESNGCPLPVVNLDASSIQDWAQVVMAIGSVSAPGVLCSPSRAGTLAPHALLDVPEESAEQRVERFRVFASPSAFRLATYLSAVDLSLPVMRLVQRAMLPESGPVQLAEVFLGGLMKRLVPPDAPCSPDEVPYDFHHGVRELLQRSLLKSETLRVLQQVTNYVEDRTGQTLDFQALVADETGAEQLPAIARPFARLGAQVLRQFKPIEVRQTIPSGEVELPLNDDAKAIGTLDESAVPPPSGSTGADLSILIADAENTAQRFRCRISSPHLTPDVTEFEWALPQGTNSIVESYMRQFEEPNVAAEQKLFALRGVGQEIWESTPREFKNFYWRLKDVNQLETIAIISDEHYFPWEVAIPHRRGEVGAPLGVECTIGRWPLSESPTSLTPPDRLRIASSLVVAPEYRGVQALKNSIEETSAVLSAVEGERLSPATFAAFFAKLQVSTANVIHLIAHSTRSATSEDILLDGDERLTPAQLSGMAFSLSLKHRPLFYLSFGVRQPDLIRAFISLGASAIVAPFWEVLDAAALQAATQFYSQLAISPTSYPAKIIRDIRAKAYESGEDSYAAFRFYGNPVMMVINETEMRAKDPRAPRTEAPEERLGRPGIGTHSRGEAILTIEQINDFSAREDDLWSAIHLWSDRLPAEERYEEEDFINMVRKHLKGDFGPHRPSAYWRAYLLLAQYKTEVVGMLLGYNYDDLRSNFLYIPYLVTRRPGKGGPNPDDISRKLVRKLAQIQGEKEDKGRPARFLAEVDDPTATNDPDKQLERRARIKLFGIIAAFAQVQLRCLDYKFLQPKLNPRSKKPETRLRLLYGVEHPPANLSKAQLLDIITWFYKQLYAANISEDPLKSQEYETYLGELLKSATAGLPDEVKLLELKEVYGVD